MGSVMNWGGWGAMFAVGEAAVVLVLVAWLSLRWYLSRQGGVTPAAPATGVDTDSRQAA
jgi:hypothetical protein